jgi:hypothetical protein
MLNAGDPTGHDEKREMQEIEEHRRLPEGDEHALRARSAQEGQLKERG